MEQIAAVALTRGGLIFSAPPPARHHTVAHLLLGVKDGERDDSLPKYVNDTHGFEQGFVTSAGRFVDRKEGWNIASAARQIQRVTGPIGVLFSEDLW